MNKTLSGPNASALADCKLTVCFLRLEVKSARADPASSATPMSAANPKRGCSMVDPFPRENRMRLPRGYYHLPGRLKGKQEIQRFVFKTGPQYWIVGRGLQTKNAVPPLS